jgi:HPt (histidine-containing phosphotransfer) domain-containing protein
VASQHDQGDSDFASQFRKIQQLFLGGLPQRMEDILQATDSQTRYTALHRLTGAAGGYGFEALSALAREAMEAFDAKNTERLHDALTRLDEAAKNLLRERAVGAADD